MLAAKAAACCPLVLVPRTAGRSRFVRPQAATKVKASRDPKKCSPGAVCVVRATSSTTGQSHGAAQGDRQACAIWMAEATGASIRKPCSHFPEHASATDSLRSSPYRRGRQHVRSTGPDLLKFSPIRSSNAPAQGAANGTVRPHSASQSPPSPKGVHAGTHVCTTRLHAHCDRQHQSCRRSDSGCGPTLTSEKLRPLYVIIHATKAHTSAAVMLRRIGKAAPSSPERTPRPRRSTCTARSYHVSTRSAAICGSNLARSPSISEAFAKACVGTGAVGTTMRLCSVTA